MARLKKKIKWRTQENMPVLRIPDTYDAKICYFWTFWHVIQLKSHLFKIWQNGLLTELQARTSRNCRLLPFLHHSYQVSLRYVHPDIFLFVSDGRKGFIWNTDEWYFLFGINWPNMEICPSSSFSANICTGKHFIFTSLNFRQFTKFHIGHRTALKLQATF